MELVLVIAGALLLVATLIWGFRRALHYLPWRVAERERERAIREALKHQERTE